MEDTTSLLLVVEEGGENALTMAVRESEARSAFLT